MSTDLAAVAVPDAPVPTGTEWSEADRADLGRAVTALERSSFASRLSASLGRQLGFAGDLVPAQVGELASAAANKALSFAMRGALKTLGRARRPAATRLHVAAVAASGALGGAFGLATLPLELPLSTTLILRAVADIAREEGEDLGRPEATLACLEVFALGGGRDGGHVDESRYFAVRAILAKSVSEAARFMVQRGLGDEAAPALVRFVGQIASRFGMVVSQKFAVQAVPMIGAVTGAAINAAFMDHYQSLARGHFIVRRLERTYGPDAVRRAYDALRTANEARANEQHGSGRTRLDRSPRATPAWLTDARNQIDL